MHREQESEPGLRISGGFIRSTQFRRSCSPRSTVPPPATPLQHWSLSPQTTKIWLGYSGGIS
jgi:hypothetical protein